MICERHRRCNGMIEETVMRDDCFGFGFAILWGDASWRLPCFHYHISVSSLFVLSRTAVCYQKSGVCEYGDPFQLAISLNAVKKAFPRCLAVEKTLFIYFF